jgi:hypothetical protein
MNAIINNTPYPVVVDATLGVSIILVASSGGGGGLSVSDLANNHTAESEAPAETPDGVITDFMFSHSILKVYALLINGQGISEGSGTGEYMKANDQIIFDIPPAIGDVIRITYLY